MGHPEAGQMVVMYTPGGGRVGHGLPLPINPDTDKPYTPELWVLHLCRFHSINGAWRQAVRWALIPDGLGPCGPAGHDMPKDARPLPR